MVGKGEKWSNIDFFRSQRQEDSDLVVCVFWILLSLAIFHVTVTLATTLFACFFGRLFALIAVTLASVAITLAFVAVVSFVMVFFAFATLGLAFAFVSVALALVAIALASVSMVFFAFATLGLALAFVSVTLALIAVTLTIFVVTSFLVTTRFLFFVTTFFVALAFFALAISAGLFGITVLGARSCIAGDTTRYISKIRGTCEQGQSKEGNQTKQQRMQTFHLTFSVLGSNLFSVWSLHGGDVLFLFLFLLLPGRINL